MRITKELKDLEPGPLVRALRDKRKLTQHQLGLAVGKFSTEIAGIESGREILGLKRARAFAEFFDVPFERFLPKELAK